MAEQLKIVAICGSLRKGSYNAALVRALPGLAPPELKIVEAPSYAGFPIYNDDVRAASGAPADVEAFAAAIRSADGVIVVSPEYNWSIPGGLKNAIDWVSKLKDVPFKNKPVALQSASGGQMGGGRMQYHLRMALESIEAQMFLKPEVFVNFAAKKIDEKTGAITDDAVNDIIKQQLAAFAKFVARVKV
ncbi:MAG: NAD(P)H-dependent oxidoreductase [Hyphomicrobiales bacterium]|nr:NAD(P)H-dependent oxidoreductase [Hyphomicrobiales bacterium]